MVSYMNDFITPCPEVTFLQVLNWCMPGLGVCISSYYGKEKVAWYSFGIGIGCMILCEILFWCEMICYEIGEWGVVFGVFILPLILTIFLVFAFLCECFMWCILIYTWVHCFFCLKKYIDLIK